MRHLAWTKAAIGMLLGLDVSLAWPARSSAADPVASAYLRDRGGGLSTSMYGTYVRPGQGLLYAYYATSRDHDMEYEASRFGHQAAETFSGKYRDSAGQLFAAYGLASHLAVELEGAYRTATFEKSPRDDSGTPAKLTERGMSDLEGQLRVLLSREGIGRPEIFGFLEITAPSHKREVLIGDSEWDVKPGLGLIKGFSWGTLTFRTSGEYTREDHAVNFGETSIEYLRRLSSAGQLFLAIEGGEGGGPDEWILVTGGQARLAPHLALKLDNELGLFPKAPDWGVQAGLLFSLNR